MVRATALHLAAHLERRLSSRAAAMSNSSRAALSWSRMKALTNDGGHASVTTVGTVTTVATVTTVGTPPLRFSKASALKTVENVHPEARTPVHEHIYL